MDIKIDENLTEEIFCLKFELDTLKGFLMENNLERWVPGFVPNRIHKHHKTRYELAKEYVKDKDILDIACGSGYGSLLLAEQGGAKSILGIDINTNAIRYGNHRYNDSKISRYEGDAQNFSLERKVDVIVSFETIEHLPLYENFLNCVEKALKPNGLFLVSTPIVLNTRTKCINPHHFIEWSFQDFHAVIGNYFDIEEIYLQDIQLKKGKEYFPLFRLVTNKLLTVLFGRKQRIKQKIGSTLEKWNNQYNVKHIDAGYQILICRNSKAHSN